MHPPPLNPCSCSSPSPLQPCQLQRARQPQPIHEAAIPAPRASRKRRCRRASARAAALPLLHPSWPPSPLTAVQCRVARGCILIGSSTGELNSTKVDRWVRSGSEWASEERGRAGASLGRSGRVHTWGQAWAVPGEGMRVEVDSVAQLVRRLEPWHVSGWVGSQRQAWRWRVLGWHHPWSVPGRENWVGAAAFRRAGDPGKTGSENSRAGWKEVLGAVEFFGAAAARAAAASAGAQPQAGSTCRAPGISISAAPRAGAHATTNCLGSAGTSAPSVSTSLEAASPPSLPNALSVSSSSPAGLERVGWSEPN